MLGPVTAAKAAAGSRTTGPAGGSPRTNHCSRAGQDGRPAPPRSAPAPAAAAAPPRRAAASVRDSAPTQVTQHNTLYTADTAHYSRTPCIGGTYAGQGCPLLPLWPGCRGGCMVPSCCSRGGHGLCFLLLCLAPPPAW